MKVFVTGATGYIGFAVAQAFRRAGYEVVGLCRSAAKARRLAEVEIVPVLGDLTKPETYTSVAADCGVLVHAAADLTQGMVGPDKTAIEALLAAGALGRRPKTLIYTSGVWVYGATGDRAADETTPLRPAVTVRWRSSHEDMVLQAPALRGLVLRPGCIYGGRGGLTADFFSQAVRESPAVVGDGRNRWAMVHRDDCADAYVRAADSGLSGEVFNVTDRSRSTPLEMASAAAREVGCQQPVRAISVAEAAKVMGGMAEALVLDQHVESWKIARRLGWQPKHGGFLDEVRTYFEAWKASQA